jgi:PAS domain S-box-containing protein
MRDHTMRPPTAFPLNEDSCRVFFENTPDPVVIYDAAGSIAYFNPALLNYSGFTSAELQHQTLSLFSPFPPAPSGTTFLESITQACTMEQSIKTKDGQTKSIEATFIPVQGEREAKHLICLWKDMSASKNLENGLKIASEKLSKLINAIPIPVAIAAFPSGIIEEVNSSFLETSGYTLDEIVGRPGSELNWRDPEERDRASGMLLEKGYFKDAEIRLETRSGELRTSLISAEIVKFGDRRYMVSASIDITDRKRMEDELRESEAFNTGLLTESPNPILVLNNNGSIRYVNPALEKLTGFPSSDLIGRRVPFPWWPAELREEYLKITPATPVSETDLFERQYVKSNGETFWCAVNIRNVITGGVIKYHILNWMDITERKKTENALRESEVFNSRLLNDAPNPILLAETDGDIRYINPALVNLTGFSPVELIGCKPPYPWWPEGKREEYLNVKPSRGLNDETFRERVFQKKNGDPFWVGITVQSIHEGGQVKYLLANWMDITERKKMEERIVDLYLKEKAQREELQEDAKTRSLFISVLAHELRTPITPILVSIGLLKDQLEQDPDTLRKKLADNILQSTTLLSQRLEELLDLGRFYRGNFTLHPVTIDIGQLIERIVAGCRASLDRQGQRLDLSLPAGLPPVKADPTKMEKVLINLLSNASQFSPQGSTLRLVVKSHGDYLLVSVKDNGAGISPQDQNKLFQPYYRIQQDRQQFPGLGLGLAVSNQIIEAHGGKIWVKSEPGRGNVFSFVIPLNGCPAIASKPPLS